VSAGLRLSGGISRVDSGRPSARIEKPSGREAKEDGDRSSGVREDRSVAIDGCASGGVDCRETNASGDLASLDSEVRRSNSPASSIVIGATQQGISVSPRPGAIFRGREAADGDRKKRGREFGSVEISDRVPTWFVGVELATGSLATVLGGWVRDALGLVAGTGRVRGVTNPCAMVRHPALSPRQSGGTTLRTQPGL